MAARVLRDARRGAGLTQTEFARRARVAQATISAYENCRRQPTLPTLHRLVAAAGYQLRVDLGAEAAE
jgi:transcriptional regulator with XRE-family HTH domain